MFYFLLRNNLISSNQIGFKLRDYFINQLLSITHDIYQSFDESFEILRVFDTLWHKGIIQKNGMPIKLLNIVAEFSKNRKQRLVLSAQASSWADVTAGVPEGSILGPLLFLLFSITL